MVKPAHGWSVSKHSITFKCIIMSNDANKNKEQNEKKSEENKVTPSSVDNKNESAVNRTPTATERVKPRAGDGLANEGTIVSYDEER
jgi:hypothetical protein